MSKFLEELYGDETARVKLAFDSEDPKVLHDLSEDSCLAVKLEVAGNENALPQTLNILAGDKDNGVRLQVAGNFNSPPEAIKKLLDDSSEAVREEAGYSDHA
ncbi:MAG: hypothetical protein ACPG8V_02900 [Alphaproteobacteria bacterium]